MAVWTEGCQTVSKVRSREALAEAPALITLVGNPPNFFETLFSELYTAATHWAKSRQRCLTTCKLNCLLISGGLRQPNPQARGFPLMGLHHKEATLYLILPALLLFGALCPLGEVHREWQDSGEQCQLYIRKTSECFSTSAGDPAPDQLNRNHAGGYGYPYLF